MRFTITKSKLLNALNTVNKAISSKNPLAILTGVKMELIENGLTLVGSDSDLTISTTISISENNETIITIFELGAVVLSGKFLLDIVRKLESELIEFELVENSLMKIRDNVSDFSLNTLKLEDYPNVDFTISGSVISLSGDTLKEIIDQTAFAASDKETRPILTGVNFKAIDRKLECIATDSYRLAKKIIEIDNDIIFNVTIPAKTLIEVGRILENEPHVEICVSAKKVIFGLKNTQISARLISGPYPDTSKIIPSEFAFTLESLSLNIISAIDRASLLSSDRNNFVKITLDANNFIISSKSMEVGSLTENVKNFSYRGDPLVISFTARYVIDAIRAIGCEEVTFYFNGDMKTFVIRNKKDETVVQLIQPVRTY